ncbi:MAG: hypothetical protein A3I05_06285 [Deltaproteobacteria bacterium RIFCSPLOWO2_02_FULL_44_10]|nr:MAG: hypothetical protein A3C46_00175 [Deltaproteobacteria bacterium RIFCSPHIGHO2_02_FULL_44_16]OGQ45393.1 MAG: hypothetical protein A3I05_06285 [Deltaproteobacteria bacterium RIFCSPLOWO2_02_FULL_44_10]
MSGTGKVARSSDCTKGLKAEMGQNAGTCSNTARTCVSQMEASADGVDPLSTEFGRVLEIIYQADPGKAGNEGKCRMNFWSATQSPIFKLYYARARARILSRDFMTREHLIALATVAQPKAHVAQSVLRDVLRNLFLDWNEDTSEWPPVTITFQEIGTNNIYAELEFVDRSRFKTEIVLLPFINAAKKALDVRASELKK